MDKDVKSLLDGIMAFDNIPRKKPKFVNFVKNVVGGGKRCSPATIEKVQLRFLFANQTGHNSPSLKLLFKTYLCNPFFILQDLEYF